MSSSSPLSNSAPSLGGSASISFIEIRNPPIVYPVKIPRLGLGVFQASPSETEEAVQFALSEGYRHFDTAQLYRNEAAVGRAIRASAGLIPRDEIFVTTKLWNSDHGYESALRAFERSLYQLGLEYVDLYLIHSPMRTDARLESWRACEDILRSGKAKAIGVSNYGIHHLQEMFSHCSVRPAVNQIELHPFCTRPELVAFCQSNGIVLEAYSPLAKGKKLKDAVLVEMAARYKKTAAQLMIRWSLQKGFVCLPKSVRPSRITSNAQVFNFEISPADMAKLDAQDSNFVTGWDPTVGP